MLYGNFVNNKLLRAQNIFTATLRPRYASSSSLFDYTSQTQGLEAHRFIPTRTLEPKLVQAFVRGWENIFRVMVKRESKLLHDSGVIYTVCFVSYEIALGFGDPDPSPYDGSLAGLVTYLFNVDHSLEVKNDLTY